MWPYLIHDSSCGCVTCTPSTNLCYAGPNLPNTGIQNNDTLSLALQKIDALLGNLLTTTTTTTTLTSLKSFNISSSADKENGYASYTCPPINNQPIDDVAYFNGALSYPAIGDTIYENINGTTLHRDGIFLFFNGSYNDVIYISSGIYLELSPLACE